MNESAEHDPTHGPTFALTKNRLKAGPDDTAAPTAANAVYESIVTGRRPGA